MRISIVYGSVYMQREWNVYRQSVGVSIAWDNELFAWDSTSIVWDSASIVV